jgi:hypothetical protein
VVPQERNQKYEKAIHRTCGNGKGIAQNGQINIGKIVGSQPTRSPGMNPPNLQAIEFEVALPAAERASSPHG